MKRFVLFPLLALLPVVLIVAVGADRPECIPMGPSAPVCGPTDCTDTAPPPSTCRSGQEQVCECQMGTLAEAEGCRWSCWCEDTGGSDFPPGYVGLCPLEPWTDPGSCGPQPGIANVLCPDGETWAGPTGRCLQEDSGQLTVVVCSWEIVECPAVSCSPNYCSIMDCRASVVPECGPGLNPVCAGDGETCQFRCCPEVTDVCSSNLCGANQCGTDEILCPRGTTQTCAGNGEVCSWECCFDAPSSTYTCNEFQCFGQTPPINCTTGKTLKCDCVSSSPGLEECSWTNCRCIDMTQLVRCENTGGLCASASCTTNPPPTDQMCAVGGGWQCTCLNQGVCDWQWNCPGIDM